MDAPTSVGNVPGGLAEHLIRSREFQRRHGSSEEVGVKYLAALNPDGLWRLPELAGLARWLAAGRAGMIRAKLLAAVASSDKALEHLQAGNRAPSEDLLCLVSCLFQTAFGRRASKEERLNAVQQLQSGVSLEDVAKGLVLSAEFEMRHGLNEKINSEYLAALYRDGLGRQQEPESLAFWLEAGRTGATRAQPLAKVAASDEAAQYDRRQLVNCLYQAAFGRLADDKELANAVTNLRSGTSRENVARLITSSAEFQRRHGFSHKVDINCITAIYCNGLGRPPNLESLAFWLEEGEKGVTQAQLLVEVAGSNEALERLRAPVKDSKVDYGDWVSLHDTINDADRAMIHAHIAGWAVCPLISVVMSIDRRSELTSRESIDSVVAQLYPSWQLCLAVDGIQESLLTALLDPSGLRDPRIRVIRPTTSESAAAAAKAALTLATGEFVAFLRAGDVLAAHALYEVAFELARNERTDIVYTDHDHINTDGQRFNPWFKPDWDSDLLVAEDYISDLAVYRRRLVKEVGFLRSGFEGAEYHDLALRCTAAIAPSRVSHLPAILCHRRSEVGTNDSQNAASDLPDLSAAHRAVRDHLNSRGDESTVLKLAHYPTRLRVVWPLPEQPPLVSVIVSTRERRNLLGKCVEGVLNRTNYPAIELLMVDNGSDEQTTFALFDLAEREGNRVRVLHYSGRLNYSGMINEAARKSRGEVLLLLDNDIDVIDPDWLRELVSHALRPDVGIVGPNLLTSCKEAQHFVPSRASDGHTDQSNGFAGWCDPGHLARLAVPRTVWALTGACAAIRRAVFFEVGGLDELNLPADFNDIDLCLRVGDYGYRVVYTPFAEVLHLQNSTQTVIDAKRELIGSELQHMQKTWGSLFRSTNSSGDPAKLLFSDLLQTALCRRRPWHYIFEHISNLNRNYAEMNHAFYSTNIQ